MLTECPECKRQVSDSAEVCPGCGYRLLGRENLVLCPRCKAQVIPQVRPPWRRKWCPLCSRPIGGMRTRFRVFLAFLSAGVIAVAILVAVLSGPTQTYRVSMSSESGNSVVVTTVRARSESEARRRAEAEYPGYRVNEAIVVWR